MSAVQIIPAILEKDLEEIQEKVKLFENLEPVIHIDVDDGSFGSNTTYLDTAAINELFTASTFELHLMVQNPLEFVPSEPKAVKKIIVQLESSHLSRDVVQEIEERGFELGIALNPETPIEELEPFLEVVKSVQFMTIHPGFQGQEFIPEVLTKIKEFKETYPLIPVQVDGGINPKTARLCIEAGATLLVSGSYLVHCEEIQSCINELEGAAYGD